jgi:hypothetical protein
MEYDFWMRVAGHARSQLEVSSSNRSMRFDSIAVIMELECLS